MRYFRISSLFALTLGTMLITTPAFADGITLTLLNPFQTINPGQTVTFNATVAVTPGNAKNIFLNADSANISDKGSIYTLDDSDFFNNFPLDLTPTGAGDSFTGAIFTVTNTGTTAEEYAGVFTVFGGANASASRKLATVDFGSPAAIAATPEPSSFILLGTGILGLCGAARRKYHSA